MMTNAGLVPMLLNSGVAEMTFDEIRFTNRFIAHLASYSEHIQSKGGAVSSWREIFGLFNSALRPLNDNEVRSIIAILDYYLHRIEVRQTMEK